jgi:NAD(P)-dependent dehydrogenase (short-subunit alcohol dehydrogenase family)
MARLESKVILLAGAGVIGNECARRYAREGASVVLGDIRLEEAEAAVDEIKRSGGEARAVHLDGGDAASIAAAVALAIAAYGGLDGLHVNYTISPENVKGADVLDIPLEMYDEAMRVNTRGYLLCTRAALPHIIARGGGAVVYTSSGAANTGSPNRVAYPMSKAAINALMRHVAVRFGGDNIRANAIAPGVVERPNTSEAVKDIARRQAKIQRMGRPTDIAGLAALLMSDEGSYITGQVISVDGGITMRP